MAQTRAFFVPNEENTRKSGTNVCRGEFRAEKARFTEAEREKSPYGAASHSVTSRELV